MVMEDSPSSTSPAASRLRNIPPQSGDGKSFLILRLRGRQRLADVVGQEAAATGRYSRSTKNVPLLATLNSGR